MFSVVKDLLVWRVFCSRYSILMDLELFLVRVFCCKALDRWHFELELPRSDLLRLVQPFSTEHEDNLVTD